MVKNRKILITIGTDIAQREADVEIPEELCDFFRQKLIAVKITPNYPDNICKKCQFYQKPNPIFSPRCEELGIVILLPDTQSCKLFKGVKTV